MTKRDILLKWIWEDGHCMYERKIDDNIMLRLKYNNSYVFNTRKDISNALYQLKKLGFIMNNSHGSYHLTSLGDDYCVNMFDIGDEDSFDSDDEFVDESEEQSIYDDEDSDEDMNQQNDSMFNNSKWTEIANHFANIAQHYAEIAKLHANM